MSLLCAPLSVDSSGLTCLHRVVFVSKAVLEELKKIIRDSKIMAYALLVFLPEGRNALLAAGLSWTSLPSPGAHKNVWPLTPPLSTRRFNNKALNSLMQSFGRLLPSSPIHSRTVFYCFNFMTLFRRLSCDDAKWPEPNAAGTQELEIVLDNEHISFTVLLPVLPLPFYSSPIPFPILISRTH